jgi:hypothetical protein
MKGIEATMLTAKELCITNETCKLRPSLCRLTYIEQRAHSAVLLINAEQWWRESGAIAGFVVRCPFVYSKLSGRRRASTPIFEMEYLYRLDGLYKLLVLASRM